MSYNIDQGLIKKVIIAAVLIFIAAKILPPDPDDPMDDLNRTIDDIKVNVIEHDPDKTIYQAPSLKEILPDISKYQIPVNSSTSSFIEIFTSPEKAGSGNDGWLVDVAREFNNAGIVVDGKPVSVRLISIASGDGADYIISKKYLPDAYTPSNELWGELIASSGIKIQMVKKRLAGNVAGILLTKPKKNEIIAKYGAINVKTIIDAVSNKELVMGYTNPLTSSTGLNFLILALGTSDGGNSSSFLNENAKQRFRTFQENIGAVAYTTQQLKDLAKSGDLNCFILEYQTYVNTQEIGSYEFIPFGFRHDSPMYAIGDLSAEKRKILDKFVEFVEQEKYQSLATKYGFNVYDEYQPDAKSINGDDIISAQSFWKETKNPGKTICAVFVADVSGSMEGEPLNMLKESLRIGQNNFGNDNMVGLVSYSDRVNIDLKIAKFGRHQKEMFLGAVRDLHAGGNTGTFDAISVAIKMLIDQKAAGPNKDPSLKPMIILLSDGRSNFGHSLGDIEDIVKAFGIPITTIGYGKNANMEELQYIANINEAACIKADPKDIAYKLYNLFIGVA